MSLGAKYLVYFTGLSKRWTIPLFIGLVWALKHISMKCVPLDPQDSDFRPKLELKAPFTIFCCLSMHTRKIHHIPLSYHTVRSSEEPITSSRLNVVMPAGRGKKCKLNSASLQFLLILIKSLMLQRLSQPGAPNSMPLGSKGIFYPLYSSCRICGFPFRWPTLHILMKCFPWGHARTHLRVFKFTLWQAVSPKHKKILT